jgi:hypothetical protein
LPQIWKPSKAKHDSDAEELTLSLDEHTAGTLKQKEERKNQSENKLEKKKAYAEEEAGIQAGREEDRLEEDARLKADSKGAQQKSKEKARSMGGENAHLKHGDITDENSTDKNSRT